MSNGRQVSGQREPHAPDEPSQAGPDDAAEGPEAQAAQGAPSGGGEPAATADGESTEGAPRGPDEASTEEGEAEGDEADEERPGLGKTLQIEAEDLPGALEALILVSDKPVAPVRLARLTRSDIKDVKHALTELRAHYADRGVVLDEVAGGYQFRTHPRHAPVVRNLIQQKPVRLTRAQLEVLAIIAYRQPVTRPEVEEVRGVDSGSALKVLLERGVIRIIGKRDEAGRPMLYATTPDFLSLFGLKSLSDLPTLKEFTELSDESRDMFERRIGERAPLEGFTEGASDARSAAEREASLKAEADSEPDEQPADEPAEGPSSDEESAPAPTGQPSDADTPDEHEPSSG